MVIRNERPEDARRLRELHRAAFGGNVEADLVDTLRDAGCALVSLVAEDAGGLIGHLLFSPVTLEGRPSLNMMGLAPMAVTPPRQRQGTGSFLVAEGLARCRALGAGAVVVLGHPDYYTRFGFRAAGGYGLACEYDAPAEAFMALELVPGYLDEAGGTVRFHPAFPRE